MSTAEDINNAVRFAIWNGMSVNEFLEIVNESWQAELENEKRLVNQRFKRLMETA